MAQASPQQIPTPAERDRLLRHLRQTPLRLSQAEWFLWHTHYRLDEEVARVAVQAHGWRGYQYVCVELRRR